MLIADQIAKVIDPIIHNMPQASYLEAVLAMLGYTLQLYFDFSGYSDMAIGIGKMFNIHFPINFSSPYKSRSITEFWQRWHISLSSWLRDYLYISLGGNREGALLTYRNVFLTMLIGGLWHGANVTFVVWGAFHGALIVLEKFLDYTKIKLNHALQVLITFFLINVGWIIFRSENINAAMYWIGKVFGLQGKMTWSTYNIITKYKDRFTFALVLGFILVFIAPNTSQIYTKLNRKKWIIFLAVLFVTSILFMNEESPFLYFQF